MDTRKTMRLLIFDGLMATSVTTQNSVDLTEIMEAREWLAATLIVSRLESNAGYPRIDGELMADSILNGVAAGARCIDLDGPNMRERFARKRDLQRRRARLSPVTRASERRYHPS